MAWELLGWVFFLLILLLTWELAQLLTYHPPLNGRLSLCIQYTRRTHDG